MIDYGVWLDEMREALAKRTGRKDIEVTGGSYRGYDVRVSHKDCHPAVDFYTAMRRDPERVNAALDYAVSLVKDWEATLAAREKEMEYVLPRFKQLQAMFPNFELRYTVSYADTHFVRAQKEERKTLVSFDLWPAMKEKDIQRLADYISKYARSVAESGGIAGADYW